MKSSRLLIHELELEIQGVSIEWVKQHQDSIVEKLTQIFNNFQLNEEHDLEQVKHTFPEQLKVNLELSM